MDKNIKLTEHKFLEISIRKNIYSVTTFYNSCASWTRKTDHAGCHFYISIWRYSFEFSIYDHRHWDRQRNCFKDVGTDSNVKDIFGV